MRFAVILAGGKGQRLQPHTSDRPKCMVPLLGNPLISYQLRLLNCFGFTNVLICCGYKHEVISEFIGDGRAHNLSVDYLIEDRPLGRGGALKAALKRIGATNHPILALNGDIITNVNITEFYALHQLTNARASLLAVPLRSPYGIVECSDGALASGFAEKPELPYWINGGVYLFSSEVVDYLPDEGDHEDTTFPELAAKGELAVFKSRAFWQAVDTVKDLAEIRDYMQKFVFSNFFQSPVSSPTTVSSVSPAYL